MRLLSILVTIFLFSLIGTAFGELLLLIIPDTLKLHQLLSANLAPIWSLEKLDILILSIKFKISFNFNIITLIGFLAGSILTLRKNYNIFFN